MAIIAPYPLPLKRLTVPQPSPQLTCLSLKQKPVIQCRMKSSRKKRNNIGGQCYEEEALVDLHGLLKITRGDVQKLFLVDENDPYHILGTIRKATKEQLIVAFGWKMMKIAAYLKNNVDVPLKVFCEEYRLIMCAFLFCYDYDMVKHYKKKASEKGKNNQRK